MPAARKLIALKPEREKKPLTQQELADLAGIKSRRTVHVFETGGRVDEESARKIRAALEALGVEFTEGRGGYWGVRIKT